MILLTSLIAYRGGEIVRICGFFDLRRCGMHNFEARNVPLVLIYITKSKTLVGIYSTGPRLIALALLIKISIPPNFSTVF